MRGPVRLTKQRQQGMSCVPGKPGTCGHERRRLCPGMTGPWDDSQATPSGYRARAFVVNFTAAVAAARPRSRPLARTSQAKSSRPRQRQLMVPEEAVMSCP
ncbi:uncharacterized protein LOC142777063 [Rhipicephalus microplus]|uniref:uncharacterized protein LOC142777063 n=1 Tax=Rhipicephalus microplus TaxID=6941 RepID=UPI003F6BFECA